MTPTRSPSDHRGQPPRASDSKAARPSECDSESDAFVRIGNLTLSAIVDLSDYLRTPAGGAASVIMIQLNRDFTSVVLQFAPSAVGLPEPCGSASVT